MLVGLCRSLNHTKLLNLERTPRFSRILAAPPTELEPRLVQSHLG